MKTATKLLGPDCCFWLTLQSHCYHKAIFEIISARVMSIKWRWRESNPRPKE